MGRPDLTEISRFLMSNLDDPDVQELFQHANEDLAKLDQTTPNLSEVNYASLPIEHETVWIINMQFGGMKTATGELLRDDHPAHVKERAYQSFDLHAWNCRGEGSRPDLYRYMQNYDRTPPNSKQVEEFIKLAMAHPHPIFKPALPHLLILSANLSHHKQALKPFLDSLPAPFKWKDTPAEIEDTIRDMVYENGKELFNQYVASAKENKASGNSAYAAKNREAAVAFFEDAIKYLDRAFRRYTPATEAIKQDAMKLKVVCHANCSAARLMGGNTSQENAEKAVDDAEDAILLDTFYVKGYMRLARAYQALGQRSDAEEAVARALRLKEMENDEGLVDLLISIQTCGKGLPAPGTELAKEWVSVTFSDDSERAERMKSVNGLWRKRCEAHMKEIQGSSY
ncbi:hypothetical protein JR316_0009121 [Psilocybe cubensis]|uniref:Uncharacterized protein n=2 Tax=Psilocybe cubensis TaxID=181762 RepID=A0ACB8GT07_PSICU|nr:hypothetical protein JR316_0009121 [Psilocybe cubensis]KAH9478663.1 hypothetical protein JR316_0009121 [Psilocybe cubensis]